MQPVESAPDLGVIVPSLVEHPPAGSANRGVGYLVVLFERSRGAADSFSG